MPPNRTPPPYKEASRVRDWTPDTSARLNTNYLGEFANSTLATAEATARGGVQAGMWYYDTTATTTYFWNDTAWTEMGGGGGSYTTTEPTTETVGGVAVGTEYAAATMQEVFDDLFHPYQLPAFSSFAMTGVTDVEVGTSFSGSKTFTWGTTNSGNVTANSLGITDVTGGGTVESAMANSGSKAHTFSVPFTRTTAGAYRFTISGTNTQSASFTRNLDINFYWKVYYGESASTSLDEAGIEGLRVGGLQAAFAATYAFSAANYKYLCFPTALGVVTSFKDQSTGLDVPFEAPATVSVTNAQSVTTNYYVYRSTNILGAAINIIVA